MRRHRLPCFLLALLVVTALGACGSGEFADAGPARERAAPEASLRATGEDSSVLHARGLLADEPLGDPAAADELVILERTPEREEDPGAWRNDAETTRYGLLACPAGTEERVPLPLEHTDVAGSIQGIVSSVRVAQRYGNPYDQKIEAEYVFPLPQDAAVTDFLMVIGERRIRGIIREREEAERIYHEARARGHVVSMLRQERPNVFTQKVANIEPGHRIEVELTFFNALRYEDGWYRFVMPMVVGPRFNPPGATDGIGAVARGASGTSGRSTEVPYLAPGEDSGHRLSLTLDLDAGTSIEEISCRTHPIETRRLDEGRARIRLAGGATIPDRDFVLRFRVASDHVKSALLTHRDERGGFFTLLLHPPRGLQGLRREPVELVFVVDCSGSMRGRPLQQAREAMLASLALMRDEDTFQIIRFSDRASSFGAAPVPATERNRERARRFVRGLEADGGTMMMRGLRAALDFPKEPGRLRFVVFMTDGFIGNEAEILAEVKRRLGDARIFSFGVGSSPNRYLMERMAKLGRGVSTFLGLEDAAPEVMERFFSRVSHPALRDLRIDWEGLDPSALMPAEIPDLFVGRPVVVCGRFEGTPPASIHLRARAGAEAVHHAVAVRPPLAEAGSALPVLWARARIAELTDQALDTPDRHGELAQEITDTALAFNLVSSYTSFVAVDSATITEGHRGTTVPVAVPVPHGVRYDTTVEDR